MKISSMVLEIQLSDGSWSEVRNLTESPWLVYFDSTHMQTEVTNFA